MRERTSLQLMMRSLARYTWLIPLAFPGHGLAAKNNHCPPLGPTLPAPTGLSSHESVKTAAELVTQVMDGILGSFNYTAVSVGMASLHDDAPILDVHYTPPVLDPRGARKIDASTVYRIGSISKVFTVLAALKSAGVAMNVPVTVYLPQLRKLKAKQEQQNAMAVVDWDSITLHALASHMGGISSNFVTDLASSPIDRAGLGLPEGTDTAAGECVATPCLACFDSEPQPSETDFWDSVGKRRPVFRAGTSPLYSNIAFALLGLVVEAVSGISYESFVKENILDVAGLESTTLSKPDDKLGAISVGDTIWDSAMGILNPSGGYYSTTEDILAFGKSILLNKHLSAGETNNWLKPSTFTSSSGTFIGAPWEIFRGSRVTLDERLVEFYTKGGDVGTHHALLVLVPDFDVVMSVLASGPEAPFGFVQLLFSQAITRMLPVVEGVGREQASAAFAGRYTDPETNSTLVLAIDDEGPGLAISDWTVRGVDVPSHWLQYLSGMSGGLPDRHVSTRLYPTGLKDEDRTAWRVGVDLGSPEQIAHADAAMFWPQANCISWGLVDRASFQGKALDEFVFTMEDGEAVGVELLGFQTRLRRTRG